MTPFDCITFAVVTRTEPPLASVEDAEVIKDGISALRYLDRLLTASPRWLQENGWMDPQPVREAAEDCTAWRDAVADTAVAALPIVQVGYSFAPDDEA